MSLWIRPAQSPTGIRCKRINRTQQVAVRQFLSGALRPTFLNSSSFAFNAFTILGYLK